MAALLLALAVGALARVDDTPESTKSMIKDGLVDGGRRLQNDKDVGWPCNVYTSETVNLDACSAITFQNPGGGVVDVYCDGVFVPDAVKNSLYFPADGDPCPGMVPADLAACELVASPQCAGPGNTNNAAYNGAGSTTNGIYVQSTGRCEPIGGQLVGQCFRFVSGGEIVYETLPCATPNPNTFAQGVCMFPDSTADPTAKPTADPTAKPTADPTAKPTADPTASPTLSPTFNPTPDQYEPLRVATADLSTKINSASTYEEAKVQVKVVKKLTKKLPACASPYKEMLRKNTNQLLRRIRKKKAWSDLAGRLTTIMNLQDNLQACA